MGGDTYRYAMVVYGSRVLSEVRAFTTDWLFVTGQWVLCQLSQTGNNSFQKEDIRYCSLCLCVTTPVTVTSVC